MNSNVRISSHISRFTLVLKGMCMGSADVVPGVSGGTMALILGIYQQLILAIKSFDLLWFKSLLSFDLKTVFQRPHFSFLIPLITGIFAAILFFTRVVPLPVLINTHAEQIYGLFFGLILASIIVLFDEIRGFTLSCYLSVFTGLVSGIYIFNMVPTNTPDDSWFIFVCGAMAICAMILPGISGSFILLMLKKYAYILNAIGHFQFSVIIPFALGAALGLMLFSRLLSYLLNRFYKGTLLFIVGILAASLWEIWPFQDRVYESLGGKEYLIGSTPFIPDQLSEMVLQSFIFALAGFFVVLLIDFLAKRMK